MYLKAKNLTLFKINFRALQQKKMWCKCNIKSIINSLVNMDFKKAKEKIKLNVKRKFMQTKSKEN